MLRLAGCGGGAIATIRLLYALGRRAPHRQARLAAVLLLVPLCAGCLRVDWLMRSGVAHTPRPADCALAVLPPDPLQAAAAMQSGGLIGVLVIDQYRGTLDERVMKKIRAEACPAGADAIAIAGITVNPMNGVQTASVNVLRLRQKAEPSDALR